MPPWKPGRGIVLETNSIELDVVDTHLCERGDACVRSVFARARNDRTMPTRVLAIRVIEQDLAA